MQTFLLIVIFILIVINLKQADELRDLERKTLDAFKIVCKKLKQNTEDRFNRPLAKINIQSKI